MDYGWDVGVGWGGVFLFLFSQAGRLDSVSRGGSMCSEGRREAGARAHVGASQHTRYPSARAENGVIFSGGEKPL